MAPDDHSQLPINLIQDVSYRAKKPINITGYVHVNQREVKLIIEVFITANRIGGLR